MLPICLVFFQKSLLHISSFITLTCIDECDTCYSISVVSMSYVLVAHNIGSLALFGCSSNVFNIKDE